MPLHLAVLQGNNSFVKILLKFGADPSFVSSTYGSCFDIAATDDIVELLEKYRVILYFLYYYIKNINNNNNYNNNNDNNNKIIK